MADFALAVLCVVAFFSPPILGVTGLVCIRKNQLVNTLGTLAGWALGFIILGLVFNYAVATHPAWVHERWFYTAAGTASIIGFFVIFVSGAGLVDDGVD